MAAENNLRSALVAVDDARTKLKRLRNHDDDEVTKQIKKAIRELDDAETQIQYALNELRRG